MTQAIAKRGTEGRTSTHVAVPSTSILSQLIEIVRDLRQHRELLFELTRRDIRLRYKQAAMGFGWALFMPILIVFSGALVRYAMAQVSGGSIDAHQIAIIALKGLGWAFFVGTISFATTSLTANANLVSKIYFPREVLPLSSLLAQGFDTAIGLGFLCVVLPFLGVHFTLQALWAPVVLLILFCFTAAATLFLSCANLFFRDVKYIVQVLLTFGIFFTPVFFEPQMLGPRGASLLMLNPIAPLLEGLRLSVVDGHNLLHQLIVTGPTGKLITAWRPWDLAYSTAWAVLGLAASALLFHRSESAFAENV